MLERTYDPAQPYQVVYYGRMSSSGQNKRSPDQQFVTCEETQVRCGYPWECLGRYRDDAVSGRYVNKRRGLQRMLGDIETELVRPDLIVVDTLERLGRAEEIAELRRKLAVEHGVLVVAADNNFADPTGVVGKAVSLVESIRATEDTRIKRHNVIRGKKDTARQKHWTGGPVPFGYGLKKVVNEAVSPPEVHSVLEVEPRQAAAMRSAFQRAAETGEGDLRLARWWNASTDIPADFKPVSPFTMGYRLSSRIYVGELVWGANRTGVVNDTRVVEANPDGALVVPEFCEPLVSRELFDRVQRLRQVRAERIRAARQAAKEEGPQKRIAPQVRGLTLKYLLTGLARCGRCNASMRPLPSGRKSKAGKRYAYYVCPRHYEGACDNSRHVREDALRAAVISRLRARLFPASGEQGQTPAWVPELLALVRQELLRYRADEPDRAAADERELQQIEQQMAGWAQSLGNPQLPAALRRDLEASYAEKSQRQQELRQSQAADQALERHLDETLDAAQVVDQLRHLEEVLAGHNPTLGNLELSRHIDQIRCHPDGRVELCGTLLGLFEGAMELVSRNADKGGPEPTPASDGFAPVKPRRRGRLRLPSLSAQSREGSPGKDTALDPERFAGLPDAFRWAESFVLPKRLCWAEEHAAAVARLRATGMTLEKLAVHFGKRVPTIRKALLLAEQAGDGIGPLPRKIPRACWAKDHAAEVARLQSDGLSVLQIARQLGKSEPTIRAALEHAKRPGAPAADGGESKEAS
jgi:DNA invertase Pin-like site-specific DNA recombinase